MLAQKSRTRRAEIRRNRPDATRLDWQQLKEQGAPGAIFIALAFFAVSSGILMLRQDVVPFRPGQWISHDIFSRVRFQYADKETLARKQREAADNAPRVYAPTGDIWGDVERELLDLPNRLPAAGSAELPADLKDIFDSGSVTALRRYVSTQGKSAFTKRVAAFIKDLRDYRTPPGSTQYPLVILPDPERFEDAKLGRPVHLIGDGRGGPDGVVDVDATFSPRSEALRNIVNEVASRHFLLTLQPKIADYTLSRLQPAYALNPTATAEARNQAAAEVPPTAANVQYWPGLVLVPRTKGIISLEDWQLLRAENHEFIKSLKYSEWKSRLGVACLALLLTTVLAGYVARYQPRVARNHVRAVAIAALLLAMLLLNQIAAIGNGPLYLFGVAPTILVAMILTIAYDQRFAIGVASIHGVMATLALTEGISFFIIIWIGVLTACFLLDDIRTRSKLIEVGGATALAMVAATAAAGMLLFDPWPFVFTNCLYAGAAGLAVGFAVLGILPFVEKSFRITTSMTLLEMADVSQPLLRRLAAEAPGTYNHSLQVATLAEAAAEAIGANSLLCRVGAYYHDVGKINKPDYFIENQSDGENRHLNLTPSVSYLIITGHVKDGIEMAREYNLPSSLVPFIQQHHGTTLVEFFYHQACTEQERRRPDQPAISDTQYRYPGPKPRTRETAILMLADAVESACRAMPEPNASRVETLVHDLAMKRLLDGQFDDCDLTMRELEGIEKSMMKTLLGIYHGRLAYPSLSGSLSSSPTTSLASIRSA